MSGTLITPKRKEIFKSLEAAREMTRAEQQKIRQEILDLDKNLENIRVTNAQAEIRLLKQRFNIPQIDVVRLIRNAQNV